MLLILLLTVWLNISDSQEEKAKYFKNQIYESTDIIF